MKRLRNTRVSRNQSNNSSSNVNGLGTSSSTTTNAANTSGNTSPAANTSSSGPQSSPSTLSVGANINTGPVSRTSRTNSRQQQQQASSGTTTPSSPPVVNPAMESTNTILTPAQLTLPPIPGPTSIVTESNTNINNNNNALTAVRSNGQLMYPGGLKLIGRQLQLTAGTDFSNTNLSFGNPVEQLVSPTPIGAWAVQNANTGYSSSWNDLRLNRTFCDAILKSATGETFYAHRVILAASSPFFKSLFTNNNNSPTVLPSDLPLQVKLTKAIQPRNAGDEDEEEDAITFITLPTIDNLSLTSIMNFIYTGIFETSAHSLEQIKILIPLAAKLQLKRMLENCCSYLIDNLTPTNSLDTFKIGQLYFCPTLLATTKLYILQNFHKILEYQEYLKLDFNTLEEFLRDDHLNVKNEEVVFETVRKWIEYCPIPQRTSRLIELFQCIRFGLMSFVYFTTEVFNWKYVTNSSAVEQSLFDASIFLTELDSRNGADIDLNDPLARPRIPYQIIFAVGGWSAGSPTSFIETYDSRSDRWFLTPGSDVTPRAYHGLVALDNLIYMIGGFDGNEHFNTVRCYDPIAKAWSEKSCMHYQRCYVSCCALGRYIYALGGFNGRTRMANAERYFVDNNQWEEIPPMARQRSDAAACATNGKVYVCGGFNGQEVLSSVEVYDPNEGQWTFIHPMQTARSGVTLTVFKGWIYAIGGFNGFTRLSTSEKYNPSEPSEWITVANMGTPRSNFAAVALDDMLFAIGGFNGTTTIPYVECYDDTTNEWFDTTPMNLNRSALSACVLEGLPNARDYSYLSRVHELLGLFTVDFPNENYDNLGNSGTGGNAPTTRAEAIANAINTTVAAGVASTVNPAVTTAEIPNTGPTEEV